MITYNCIKYAFSLIHSVWTSIFIYMVSQKIRYNLGNIVVCFLQVSDKMCNKCCKDSFVQMYI